MKIYNPATGEVISDVKTDSAESIQKKFQAAQKAQTNWAKTPLDERIQVIQGFKDLLIQKKESLSKILTQEVGKPISQSRNELNGVVGRIDFFLQNTASVMQDETVFKNPPMEEVIRHEPLGVIANISAWNYPYFVGSNVFIPALLTGNAVLYKPSEYSTLTGNAICDLFYEAGLPSDLFALVTGAAEAGAELLKCPLSGLFFTGSYSTGNRILKMLDGKMIKTQFELGGKDPVYVCEDVDVESVAEGVADGAFYNTGQSCCSVERIYVHHSKYERFLEAFIKTVKGFVMGDPTNESTYIGPVTRSAHLEYLEYQVKDALQKGAQLHLGGKRVPGAGYYFEPTVFSNVNHEMALMKEETFGPMIGIQKVQDDQEALEMINDSPYGLTTSVYSKDQKRAEKILSQANSGTVYWNCCDRVSPKLPWTGRGHSGMGSTLSKYGILAFVQPKAWHLRS